MTSADKHSQQSDVHGAAYYLLSWLQEITTAAVQRHDSHSCCCCCVCVCVVLLHACFPVLPLQLPLLLLLLTPMPPTGRPATSVPPLAA
jgi:hypothetical protein